MRSVQRHQRYRITMAVSDLRAFSPQQLHIPSRKVEREGEAAVAPLSREDDSSPKLAPRQTRATIVSNPASTTANSTTRTTTASKSAAIGSGAAID